MTIGGATQTGWPHGAEEAEEPRPSAPFREEPFVVGDGDERLYGVRYVPAGAAGGSAPPCVLLNPLDNEGEWSIRFYVRLARRLAATGRTVARFDYRGTGNSGGAFSDVCVASLLEDVDRAAGAIEAAAAGMRPSLVGARFGATVALLAAGRRQVAELLLLDPVLDVPRYVTTSFVNKEILSRKLAGVSAGPTRAARLSGDGRVELCGTVFGERFYRELTCFEAPRLGAARAGRMEVVLPEGRLSAGETAQLERLRCEAGAAVRFVPVRRGTVGWGAENFTRESQLAELLAENAARFFERTGT